MNQINFFIRHRAREISLALFLLALVFFFQLKNERFLSLENIGDLTKNSAILSIMSIGMMLVMVSRGIDLSVGSILAFSGMASGMFVQYNPQFPLIVSLLLGVLLGAACGFINGLFIAKFNIQPVIVTLATMNLFRGFTVLLSNGAWVSANELTASFKALAFRNFFGINSLVWITILLYLLAGYLLIFRKMGRRIYAVGANPESARVSGINVQGTLLLSYVIMGLLSGLAGVLWVSRFASAQGDSATGYELQVIASCALGGVAITGGVGRLTGILLGALLLSSLNNALPLINVSPFWQYALHGSVALLAILINALISRFLIARAEKKREQHVY